MKILLKNITEGQNKSTWMKKILKKHNIRPQSDLKKEMLG